MRRRQLLELVQICSSTNLPVRQEHRRHFTAASLQRLTPAHISSSGAMAVPETNHSDAPRVDCARPLLDFDWKLKYAVASGTIAPVNKPLLRLELYVSKSSSKVEEEGIGRVLPENPIQTSVAEFTRAQLDTLIGAMSAIELAMEGAGSAT